jgi:TetR/AcrR family transcriptional regulator, regulator of cefoperazone and chloramphenicol sensitivity
MRSAYDDPPRSSDDLTAQARIRDAAIRLFADRGYPGTSIRDVARSAGVSPGLVQHHYGSKEGLRHACDVHVRDGIRTLTARKLERREYDADFISSLMASAAPVTRYIARGLTESWPGMAYVFDQAAGDSAAWLSDLWPDRFPPGSQEARTHGAVLATISLGTLVLHVHLTRWMGVDAMEPEQQHLRSAAMVEVIARMGEFLETDTGRSMRSALTDYERRMSSSGTGERDE